MSNQWLRLWHDMPTDPKWRVIARASKQPLSLVIALYTVLLVDASKNTMSRGVTKCHDEDLAVTLDCDIDQIKAIKQAMEGRVLDGDHLSGWETRQPKKEDAGNAESGAKSAAARKREQREREKQEAKQNDVTPCHGMSRNVTLDKDKEEDKEYKTLTNPIGLVVDNKVADHCPHQQIIALYHEVLPMCPRIRDWTPARATQLRARWNEAPERQNLGYWRKFFEYVKTCDFLVGRAGRNPFFADLEWMTKAGNFTKIREEKYVNKEFA